MAHYKISNLINVSTASKFMARKWIEVNDLSGGQYFVNKTIRFKTLMLRSGLCDYGGNYAMISGSLWNYHRDEID